MGDPLRAERARRVVVTGLGAVSACGWGIGALERGLRAGATQIRPLRRFDATGHRTQVGGEVPPPPPELVASFPDWRRLTWTDRFALAAALEAVEQAGLGPDLAERQAGLFFASSTGGMLECESWFSHMLGNGQGNGQGNGRRMLRPAALGSQQVNGPGDAVARRLLVHGPVETVSSACASGSLALGAALAALRRGEVEVAIAGGADALCQTTYAGFNALRSVDLVPCRPFRRSRAGLSLGEGAGVLLLEELSSALARGATPLAELAGAGASCDAHHMTAPRPDGGAAARAALDALQEAGLPAGAIDFVNAHGTGTAHNDAAEWAVLRHVFGEEAARVPVEATKALVGHLLGSAGALEGVVTVLALRSRLLHSVPGDEDVDPETPVDLVRQRSRPLPQARSALSLNLAFGGANAAVVLTAWTGA